MTLYRSIKICAAFPSPNAYYQRDRESICQLNLSSKYNKETVINLYT